MIGGKMSNPRITITVREDLYEQVEARRLARRLSRGRMIEIMLERALAAEELDELQWRSPVIERLERMEEMLETGYEELAAHVTRATEERVVPRVVDAAIRAQTVYEMMARISTPAAKLDREQIRSDAARALKRGRMAGAGGEAVAT
jgi:seryl-tRNA(Sec) selenium transferase